MSSFGIPFWYSLGFSVLLGILATGIYWFETSPSADIFLRMPSTIRAWFITLFGRGDYRNHEKIDTARDITFISGDEMMQEFKIRLTRGVFLHEGRMRHCSLALVPIPPGTIGRIHTEDKSFSAIAAYTRFLTVSDENLGDSLTVTILERSVRWQALLSGGIETSDGYRIRIHLAVHSSISAAGENDSIGLLFDEYQLYKQRVQTWAAQALKSSMAEQSYDQSIRQGDKVLADINSRWKAESSRLLKGLNDLITTEFTGFVIKPRQEAELTRFSKIFAQVNEIGRRLEQQQRQSQVLMQSLIGDTERAIDRLSTALSALDGQPVRPGANPQSSFADGLVETARHQAGLINYSHGARELVELAQETFRAARDTFEQASFQYIAACDDLADAIRRLRVEQSRSISEGKARVLHQVERTHP